MVQQVPVRDVFETNGYFYIEEKTGHGFLIDPGAEAERLLGIIRKNGWVIEKILLTHGHFDHTGAVAALSEELKIPYLIHRNGKQYLTDTRMNLSAFYERHVMLEHAAYFDHGERIRLQDGNEGFSLQVLHTPGHTPDSVVLYNQMDGIAFVGDTIFRGSIGTTRYPGGNPLQLQNSILKTIFSLPEETVICSGHSDPTTVEAELRRLAGISKGGWDQ